MFISRTMKYYKLFWLGTVLIVLAVYNLLVDNWFQALNILILTIGLMMIGFTHLLAERHNSLVNRIRKKMQAVMDAQWEIKRAGLLSWHPGQYKMVCTTPYGSFSTQWTDINLFNKRFNIYYDNKRNEYYVEAVY